VKLRHAAAAIADIAALIATPGVATAAPVRVQSAVQYRITVFTGTPEGAGTDANVKIKIHGWQATSGWLTLDNEDDNHEEDKIDQYYFWLEDLGAMRYVEISFDHSGRSADWYLEGVNVTSADTYGTFPHYKWLTKATTLRIDNAAE
jgi:hypothetical protein